MIWTFAFGSLGDVKGQSCCACMEMASLYKHISVCNCLMDPLLWHQSPSIESSSDVTLENGSSLPPPLSLLPQDPSVPHFHILMCSVSCFIK